jgi:hypothetical protein
MRIRAQLHAMAESEIKGMISEDILASIKSRDKSPMIKAFVVGHEGEARGNLIGVGNIVKRWFTDAVQKLFGKLNAGLQLFHGHAETNDTAGRIPIGEVVGKKLMNIKDRLSSVVACWIYPDYRHLPLDVASIEADIDLRGDNKSNLYVADVNEISGIALGNSEVETPGFPGATLLGQLQAFAERKNKITLFEGGDMTLAELKQAIQEGKLKPTDVFDTEAIFADSLVSEQVKEKISNARGYDIRKFETLAQEKADLAKKLTDAEAKITEHENAVKTLKIESAKAKVDKLFETQKTERKFDERQAKYIQNRLERFSPKEADEVEKEFGTWLDSQVDDYKKDAEALGIKIDGDNGGDPKKKADGGTGPESHKESDTDNKYLDPAQNPMIKIDAD